MHTCTHVHLYTPVVIGIRECGGQRLAFRAFVYQFPVYSETRSLLLNLEITDLARPASQHTPGILLPTLTFYMVLEIQTDSSASTACTLLTELYSQATVLSSIL